MMRRGIFIKRFQEQENDSTNQFYPKFSIFFFTQSL